MQKKISINILLFFSISFSICVSAQVDDINYENPNTSSKYSGGRNRLMEEVVVRAQRREESLQEVPVAVSAFSGEQMEALGIVDTKDLSAFIPGFTASDGGYGNPVYTLRGVGFNDASYFATPTAAVYYDEVNLPYSIMSKGANIDIRQVEVLKGPQGTLFGRSTTGGLINYIPESPTEMFEAGITFGYSRFETTDAEGFVSGPINDDLQYRLAGRYINRSEGWQYSNTDKSKTIGEQSKYSFRGILDWQSTEDLEFRFTYSHWRDTSDAQAGQPATYIPQTAFANIAEPVLTDPGVRNYPYIPQEREDNRVAEWCKGDPTCDDINGSPLDFTVDETFDQISIKSRWYINDRMEAAFLASYTRFIADDSQFPTGAYPEKHAELQASADIDVFDIEARLNGMSESRDVEWIIGLHVTPIDEVDNLLMINFGDSSSVIFPVSGTGVTVLDQFFPSPAKTEYRSIAPYANLTWDFAETFTLNLGGRYTKEERDYEGCVSAQAGDTAQILFYGLSLQRSLLSGTEPESFESFQDRLLNGGCISIDGEGNVGPFVDTLDESSFSFRAVVDWAPVPEYLFYASRSRGYKSGSFPLNNAADARQLRPVTQEQLDAYEIGTKLKLLGGGLQINAAAFYYDYKDKQLYSRFVDQIFGALPALDNAPESEVKGAEADFKFSPFANLFITGAVAYIDTEVTSFENAFNTRGEPEDLSGSEFNFSPKLTYSVFADYSIRIGSDLELGLGVDYSYTDETNSTLDADPAFSHPEYGITNARLRFGREDETWKITVWGRNILNEYYVTSVFPAVGDVKFRYTGMPQTYGVTFAYNYF